MGTICALNYANIFKGKFEKTCIYPYKNSFSNFYCQFIDDIFFLWNETVVQLQEFISKLSNCHPAIKFNFKYSKTSIKFLDTTVYINKEQNKLLTTVYCKPTDRRNFLHYTLWGSYGFSVFGIWLFFEQHFGILIKNETVFGIATISR